MGCRGRLWPEMPSGVLHNQIEFLVAHLDVGRARGKAEEALEADPTSSDNGLRLAAVRAVPAELVATFDLARVEAERALSMCAYHFVAPNLFNYVARMRKRDLAHQKRRHSASGALQDLDDAIVVENF